MRTLGFSYLYKKNPYFIKSKTPDTKMANGNRSNRRNRVSINGIDGHDHTSGTILHPLC
jgi:hypothetical protein